MNNISLFQRWLHWSVAMGVLAMLLIGYTFTKTNSFDLYQVHETIGMLLILIVLLRIIVRLRSGWPGKVTTHKNSERILARAVHWVLLISSVVMPISGLLTTIYSGYGLNILNFQVILPNITPNGEVHPDNITLLTLFSEMHKLTAVLLILSITLHVIGALKHHFIDKDITLLRMIKAAPSQEVISEK